MVSRSVEVIHCTPVDPALALLASSFLALVGKALVLNTNTSKLPLPLTPTHPWKRKKGGWWSRWELAGYLETQSITVCRHFGVYKGFSQESIYSSEFRATDIISFILQRKK